MATKTMIELTNEKFQEVYASEKFRNQVAYAHGYSSKELKCKITCSYPITYIVKDEQINIANELVKKAKIKTLEENKNKLLFVAMGGDFEASDGYIDNHRIRTEFYSIDGKQYFIEVGTSRDNKKMRCDHSIDRNLEIKLDSRANKYREILREEKAKHIADQSKIDSLYNSIRLNTAQPYYNYKNLERCELGEYTYKNLLEIVNKNFNCAFNEIVIDKYNISCDGVICESPKK